MDLYARQRRYFARAYETGEHGWPTIEPSDFVVDGVAAGAEEQPDLAVRKFADEFFKQRHRAD